MIASQTSTTKIVGSNQMAAAKGEPRLSKALTSGLENTNSVHSDEPLGSAICRLKTAVTRHGCFVAADCLDPLPCNCLFAVLTLMLSISKVILSIQIGSSRWRPRRCSVQMSQPFRTSVSLFHLWVLFSCLLTYSGEQNVTLGVLLIL